MFVKHGINISQHAIYYVHRITIMILHWFINFGQIHDFLVYGVIIILSFIEGPILAFLCGILFRVGAIAFLPAYIALMIGDLIGDTLWYWIGRRYGLRFVQRYGHYFHIDEQHIGTVEQIFRRHSNWILILSKVTMGLGFALVTLITAGMSKIPFGRYIVLNVIGQFFWTALLMALGFFFSNLFVTFDNLFARIAIAGAAIIFVVLLYRYAKFVRTKYSSKLMS